MFQASAATVLAAAVVLAPAAGGDDAAEFYKGKRVRIIAGYAPGSAGDAHARLLARHIGKYIPGKPTVIVQNMPGAGSLVAANFLYAAAPHDGTVLGTFSRDMPMLAIVGRNGNVRFDPVKFAWLGSSSNFSDDALLLVVRREVAPQSIEELRHPGSRVLVLGATGEHVRPADVPVALREPAGINLNLAFGGVAEQVTGSTIPQVLREALGLDVRVISGFPDTSAIDLAIVRKEIDGRMASLSAVRAGKPQWLDPNGPMHVLVQFGRSSRHLDLPHVPTAQELAQGDGARQLIALAEIPFSMSRPYTVSPEVPPERVAVLRKAFLAAHENPEFLAGAARLGLEVSPIGADDVLRLIDRMEKAPPEVRERLRKLRAEDDGE